MTSVPQALLLEEGVSLGNRVGSEDIMGRGWPCRHVRTHTALGDLEGWAWPGGHGAEGQLLESECGRRR